MLGMAKLSSDEVKKIAKLSRLNLNDSQIGHYTSQLSKVIEYIGELSKVDIGEIEPTSQTTGLENVVREDAVAPDQALSQDKALSGTDNTYNGLFKVNAILSERTDK